MPDLSERIAGWQVGDKASLDEMLPAVYDELRRLARIYLSRERPGHSLQPTELVNEAYMSLVGQRQVDWRNRAHFLGIAAQALRRVLLHHAETRGAKKREGYANRVSLDAALASVEEGTAVDIIVLDRAMERLAQVDERQAKVVELRVFGGLTVDEAAEVLGLSSATIKREWTVARLWLRRELA
jgi:RNA polymerase sigma factor (TIGR02999 family)